ncbi:THAP domain-containing protein 6-like isoform X2 [Mugil cephalus]|uniref:THAP domain-containing protein 6-like isoform X2 n=1 Tax=Mugil cephalus TaxID=48193 RepID=UPI001FB71577|nr:THAP domain-containing protein 6-like isoform X2 [Mugil cephalus]
MVAECAAAKCHTKRSRDSKSAGITFHTLLLCSVYCHIPSRRFPKDEALRRKWSVAMRRPEGWRPSQWDVVCSVHFLPEDFDRTGQTVRLRKGVVPTVFPNLPQHLQKSTVKPRSTLNSQVTTVQELPTGPSSKKRRISSVQINDAKKVQPKLDHDYSCSSSETLRLKWLGAQDQIQKLKRRLVKVRMRECRTKKAMRAFLVGELGQNDVLAQELQTDLDERPKEAETRTLSQNTQDSRPIQHKPKKSWNQFSTPRQRWLLRVMDTTLDFPRSVQDETEDQNVADSDASAESVEPTPNAPSSVSCRNQHEDSDSGRVEHKEGSESEHRAASKHLPAESDPAPDAFTAFGNQVASELRRLKDTENVRRLKKDIMNMIHETRDAERDRSQS